MMTPTPTIVALRACQHYRSAASGQAGRREAAAPVRPVPFGAGFVPRVVRDHGGDHAHGLLLPLPWSRHGLRRRRDREVLRRQGMIRLVGGGVL